LARAAPRRGQRRLPTSRAGADGRRHGRRWRLTWTASDLHGPQAAASSIMSKLFNYSFSLTPPAPPKPRLHEYAYSEFAIFLSDQWRQTPSSQDNTFLFHSEELSASITISGDFYVIPEHKAQLMADKNLDSRQEGLEQLAPGRVVVRQRTIKPHSTGVGLELSFIAEVADDYIYMYLGYVTSRKILNFTLVCPPGGQAAAALYNELVGNFRARLP
jgi:hypothetical protein